MDASSTSVDVGAAAAGSSPYAAPPISLPTAEDAVVMQNRKQVLRALDTKISQQDPPTALAAIELMLKLINNIVANPDDPKFRKFRANNPTISQKLIRCPGGQDLLVALGFRTKVFEFEEHWVVEEGPLLLRTLSEACPLLENYRDLERKKVERNAKQRQEKLANINDERQRTLQAIAEDQAQRRDKARMAAANKPAAESQTTELS